MEELKFIYTEDYSLWTEKQIRDYYINSVKQGHLVNVSYNEWFTHNFELLEIATADDALLYRLLQLHKEVMKKRSLDEISDSTLFFMFFNKLNDLMKSLKEKPNQAELVLESFMECMLYVFTYTYRYYDANIKKAYWKAEIFNNFHHVIKEYERSNYDSYDMRVLQVFIKNMINGTLNGNDVILWNMLKIGFLLNIDIKTIYETYLKKYYD